VTQYSNITETLYLKKNHRSRIPNERFLFARTSQIVGLLHVEQRKLT